MGTLAYFPDTGQSGDFCADFTPEDFARCASLITDKVGIKMPASKLKMVQSRLTRVAREKSFPSVRSYLDHLFLNLDSLEMTHFLDSITTNKTDFFREPEHFAYLETHILPTLNRAKVWSAACSSGPEPYTLAMVLSEWALRRPSFSFKILATDVSTKMLEEAQKGIYREASIEPVPEELRIRYLLREKSQSRTSVRIAPALRQTISFHHLNLMEEEYGVIDTFDVIFLRNVLIYFEPAVQQEVVTKLCHHLTPKGHLITGLSEPLSNLDVPLMRVGPSVYRRKVRRGHA